MVSLARIIANFSPDLSPTAQDSEAMSLDQLSRYKPVSRLLATFSTCCSRESLEAKPVIPLHPVTHPCFLCPQCWKSLTTTFCLRLGLGGLGIRTLGPICTHQRSIVFIALQMNLLTSTTRERSSRSCISAIILQMHVRDRSHCVYKGS